MKWIFLICLLLLTPGLTAFLKSERKWIPAAAFALAILPFLESGFNLAASPVSWPTWPGYAKGTDLSFVDAVAVSLIFATRRVSTSWAIKGAFAVYLLAYLISTIVAQSPVPALFYGWQLVRVVLVYYAVARATALSEKVPIAIFTGLVAGLTLQAGVATSEFLRGVPRAGGWFGHPNLLGMVSHFVVYPAFAVFLGGRFSKLGALAVLAGLVVAFVGGSRATIGLIAAGLVITAILSMWRQSTGRKAAVAGLGMLVLIASAPFLYSAIERRSDDARAKSNDERVKMEEAAGMVMSDYPLGVGANNYVVVANLGGYSARADVPWNEDNRSAPVHNSYYLISAEMGLLGLIGFLLVIASVLRQGVSAVRRTPPGFENDLALGMVVTILMVVTHAYFEWIVMLFPVHMFLALAAGLIVGLRARQTSAQPAVRSASKAGMARVFAAQ